MKNNVVCMKWGTRYSADDVNKLYSMVKRNLTKPFRFVCFTDDSSDINPEVECMELPPIYVPPLNDVSPWRKLSMFTKNLGGLEGRALFLDLDLVIVDNIDCFFEYSTTEFCIIENWTQMNRGIGNSSVYLFTIGAHENVLQKYNDSRSEVLAEYDNEQIFLSKTIKGLKFWPSSWCKSFKIHCLPGGILNWFLTPKMPKNVKIVVFHGNPKPSDAIIGKWPGTWRKHVRPTAWIAQYWR